MQHPPSHREKLLTPKLIHQQRTVAILNTFDPLHASYNVCGASPEG